jgi:hypothetical protein
MVEITIRDLLLALDSIGRVYRSQDGAKPADAILKLKNRLSSAQELTVNQWVVEDQTANQNRRGIGSRSSPRILRRAPPPFTSDELTSTLKRLEVVAGSEGSEPALNELQQLNMRSSDWKMLAKLSGCKATGIESAKLALRGHLAGLSQSRIRGQNIHQVFQ